MGMTIAQAEQFSGPLIERLHEFFDVLKRAGLNVTPGRMIDSFRALRLLGIESRQNFRLALRTNLAASREHEGVFDRLFDAFWAGLDVQERKTVPVGAGILPPDAETQKSEAAQEAAIEPQRYGRRDVMSERDLAARWPGESPEMQHIVRHLARKLATRPSRRLRCAARGPRIDLRRSLRKNARYGMEMVRLARLRRKLRKTRLVLLCDVSGSMDEYNPFLLQLLLGLQRAFRNSRTVVFSVKATEITGALRRRSVVQTLNHIGKIVHHWSGGTDIGAGLAHLNRQVMREGPASATVAIIVSDGYDQGDPARVEREMRMLASRARCVVWINPLLATEGYAPVAKAMRAALPCLDYFLSANDLPSLRALCSTLQRV